MPLMNRIVRVESGACALLKNPAVRAMVTAASQSNLDAPGRAYTPRITPRRSTTAAASVGSVTADAAAARTACTSPADNGGVVCCVWTRVLELASNVKSKPTSTSSGRTSVFPRVRGLGLKKSVMTIHDPTLLRAGGLRCGILTHALQ